MKIGIMGGTFDPIHKGHLMIADEAYHQFSLDKVWFMPNGNPPHKQEKKDITDVSHRKAMVELAIEEFPYFSLNSYEADHPQISYSYETMEHFHQIYPEQEFYFIIGADSLFSIEHWVHPERLLKTCIVLAAYRDDKDTPEEMEKEIIRLNKEFGSDIRLLKTPLIPISSSELRHELKSHENHIQYLPAKVSEYIIKEHLYGSKAD